ncbi:response regulator [Paraglaciecola aestuariivivens]
MSKFLIADDHPLFRDALIAALHPLFEQVSIIQADNLQSTMSALQENQDLDLVLLDLNMPDCDNFYGLIHVTQEFPEVPVVVISANEGNSVVTKVMSLGAKGFIPKSTPSHLIANALKQIMRGENWVPEGSSIETTEDNTAGDIAKLVGELTPKQFKVLKLIQNGLLNKQIAFDLDITEATVKAHISAIFRKLKVNTRTQAVLLLNNLNIE